MFNKKLKERIEYAHQRISCAFSDIDDLRIENRKLNEKLDRLIDYLGLEEKSEDYIDILYTIDRKAVKTVNTKKYFVKRKK